MAGRRAVQRVAQDGGLLRASEVLLTVGIVSPGSRRMDLVVKRGEYADAGILHYWIVDIEAPVSLVACRLAGDFCHRDSGEVTGVFEAVEPFRVRIDLDALA